MAHSMLNKDRKGASGFLVLHIGVHVALHLVVVPDEQRQST